MGYLNFLDRSLDPSLALPASYDLKLVALSFLIAAMASYASFGLARRINNVATTSGKRVWLFSGAFVLGSGIWTMHFIGMLAYSLPVPIAYDLTITIGSMLPAILAGVVVLRMTSGTRLDFRRLALGGVLLGAGIGAMHYTGMAAMHIAGTVYYDPVLFGVSIVVAIILAVIALYFNANVGHDGETSRPFLRSMGSATMMASAITGMHYTAMAATICLPQSVTAGHGLGVPPWVLAIILSLLSAIIIGMAIVAVLVTELQERAAARLQAIMDYAADGIITIDPRGRIETSNPAACGIFGFSADEMAQKDAALLIPGLNDKAQGGSLRDYLSAAGGKIIGKGMQIIDARRKDGSVFPMGLSVGRMKLEGKDLFVGTVRDLTEQVQAEHAVRKSEEMLRKIYENTNIGIFVRNLRDRTIITNDAVCEIFGYSREELAAVHLSQLTHPDDADVDLKLRAQLVAGEIDSYQITKRFIRKDGKPIWVLNDLSSIRDDQDNVSSTVSLFQDLTQQKQLEEQLRQVQKMDSLGTLAGGVAHELNNMLFPIQGMTELTLMEVEKDSLAYKNLSVVLKSAERASELVEKILSFSHQDKAERNPVVLGDVIEDELALLRSTLPSTIRIHTEIDESPVTVLADETQIHQILMNLASNAAHAMGGKVGDLTIGLSAVDLRDDTKCALPGIEPASYAKLTVRDTGHGMDKGTLERIFDPFFTTKEVGEGTGMGLAMIHGIVTAHGGVIDVDSLPGAGTAFTIYLPLAENVEPALTVNG